MLCVYEIEHVHWFICLLTDKLLGLAEDSGARVVSEPSMFSNILENTKVIIVDVENQSGNVNTILHLKGLYFTDDFSNIKADFLK